MKEKLYTIRQTENVHCVEKIYYLSKVLLEHIIPLNRNGKDDIDNLKICYYQCNQIKGSFLTTDLLKKTNEVFIYQMSIKYGNKLFWKIICRWLCRITL